MGFEPFTTLTAIAAPMPWADINTDDIFPGPAASPVLRRGGQGKLMSDRSKMGSNAFAALRWLESGDPNPDFVLNAEPYDRAQILVAGENFGCGSSREMAVWCLLAIGIRCVVAPSFGDIFESNCIRNGLLPVRLPPAAVGDLLTIVSGPSPDEITVDLLERCVASPTGRRWPFDIGEYQRHALLEGLDEVGATLARVADIDAFEHRYFARRPWLEPEVAGIRDEGRTRTE